MIYYIAFSTFAIIELYFFAMQRSCLEISRGYQIDPKQGRLMLPLWYTAVWPTKIIKYASVYFIYAQSNIWVALGCLAVPFVISAVMPIPHMYFISIFEKKVNLKDGLISPTEYFHLSNALNNAKDQISNTDT